MIEEFGPRPPHKWLTLLDMGYVIANRYNVSPNVSIYCIGFINRNHWVQVSMKEGFPLPPVTVDWKKFRSPGRLQHWQQLTPILPTHYEL
ncbi:unnamed protein product [Lathyrus sativus]|nr:unnamed protein product [Lathyrus sativus]